MTKIIDRLYARFVLGHARITLLLLAALFAFFAYWTKDFRLDASADSLLLENDEDLRRFREINERYATREFLFVTYTPSVELFSDTSLETIRRLRDDLSVINGVESVVSLVDTPLVKQKEGTLLQLAKNYRRLLDPDVDRVRAKRELLDSPLFSELIVSRDGSTTALQVSLKGDPAYQALQKTRNELVMARYSTGLTPEQKQELAGTKTEYEAAKTRVNRESHGTIEEIRAVMGNYRQWGELHLGGVPMITDDMISFVKNDLEVFGVGVFLFLVGTLAVIFRRARWVVLPLLSCVFAGVIMVGMLGLVGWRVTVISSNFISLMLIITMSMNVHLIVRYRQLRKEHPEWEQPQLVAETARRMFWPCLYTALTTQMGFGSLVLSGIKPVIDFGWMMTVGLAVTVFTSFLLFPAGLVLMDRSDPGQSEDERVPFMSLLARTTERHGKGVVVLSVLIGVASVLGMMRLEVENSFINYFSDSTEIHQGLKLIDDKLGGTSTLDVMLKFNGNAGAAQAAEDEEEDDFAAVFGDVEVEKSDYWFSPEKVDLIKSVHDYLESLPAVGKVLSLASTVRLAESLTRGQEFDTFELAVLYKRLPPELRASMIDPYVSLDEDEARLTLRVLDSLPDLRRKELLDQIESDLQHKLGLKPAEFEITGLLVLYNNMLQSLFHSQILTLGVVMLGIWLMLLVLFRSLSLSVIGIIPNILTSLMVLGLMGWLGAPLDMMTITIASITIGIAVDNSIHYIYRFREELQRGRDYLSTMHYCHAHIGRAVYYTAIIIIAGFSILVMSNFIPTIYFGLLTALAMFVALLAALTLLPKLVLLWRPF